MIHSQQNRGELNFKDLNEAEYNLNPLRCTKLRDQTQIHFAKQKNRMKGKVAIYIFHYNQTFVSFFLQKYQQIFTIITSPSKAVCYRFLWTGNYVT